MEMVFTNFFAPITICWFTNGCRKSMKQIMDFSKSTYSYYEIISI